MSIILFALAATALMFAVVGAISMMLGLDKEDSQNEKQIKAQPARPRKIYEKS